jgi:hypothetical protein
MTGSTAADPLPDLAGELVCEHRPWPRKLVEPEGWSDAIARLASGSLSLLGLWGEDQFAHMALADKEERFIPLRSVWNARSSTCTA